MNDCVHSLSPWHPDWRPFPFPSHPQKNATGAWIRLDEFPHVYDCNWGGVFAHIWQESQSMQLSSERWNDEQWEIQKEKWNKRVTGGEKALRSKYKRKRERLSLSWWRDGKIGRKKKGIAEEYETRKDRQSSESQFVCSLVGWHWLRPAFLPWPLCQSSQTAVRTHVSIRAHTHTHTHEHTHTHTHTP